MKNLVLQDMTSDRTLAVSVGRLLVAGFTGRDREAAMAHVEELAHLGVPAPDSIPTLYPLDPALLAQTEVLVVAGTDTSGEVEPVLVHFDGQLWLTVGSDHTDREVERDDIAASKAACGKVIGTTCIPLAAVADPDTIGMESDIEDGVAYQRGTMASITAIPDLLQRLSDDHGLQLRDGDVLFLGTIAAIGGIRPASRLAARLIVPEPSVTMTLAYRIVERPRGRMSPPLAKPETEFTAVDATAWTPVPGGPDGLTERILAPDDAHGIATRMLRFEPGTDTSANGVLRHDFWEEVYILEGELHDLTLDRVFSAGMFACRPPGMPHGPWRSEPGCVTFEVRYPAG
jgi:hypothetical protein